MSCVVCRLGEIPEGGENQNLNPASMSEFRLKLIIMRFGTQHHLRRLRDCSLYSFISNVRQLFDCGIYIYSSRQNVSAHGTRFCSLCSCFLSWCRYSSLQLSTDLSRYSPKSCLVFQNFKFRWRRDSILRLGGRYFHLWTWVTLRGSLGVKKEVEMVRTSLLCLAKSI